MVTPETFQPLRGRLKENAVLNMSDMSVTDETFQPETLPLNFLAP